MQTPHDQIFHYTFGQPANAADLLRSTLPATVSASIDWQTLTRCDAKLTDAASESLYADLLFTVSVLGTTAYLLFLCEHKSEEDRMTALQLLPYLPRIWVQHAQDARLPPILCVVLHHGRRPWQAPRSQREMIDVSGLPTAVASSVLARQPDLSFHVIDLAAESEAQVMARVDSLFGRATLLCMQFLRGASEEEAEAALRRWLYLLRQLHSAADARDAFSRLIEYIVTVADVPRERVLRILAEVHPDAEQIAMKTYGRVEREFLEREARGEARGEAKGKAEILLRQLQTRFGPLPKETIARVHGATTAEADRWAVRVLDATTVDDVFSEA